jgi:CheY-like chemotaxis protein
MLPTAALDLLRLDIAEAEALATQGKITAGFEMLRAGRARAQAAAGQGHAWATVLVGSYEEALESFSRRFGLPSEVQQDNKEKSVPVVRDEILLVEDDPESREAVSELLKAEGYAVTGARDGHAALRSLQRRPRPCLVLLDLRMAGMDGWLFRQTQRQNPALATIPVVIVSAVPISVVEARELDAAGYLLKPYDPDALLSLVGQH